ncbi:MAG: T9SS type A sorting domain-containing protein [Flavobacterium sp.]
MKKIFTLAFLTIAALSYAQVGFQHNKAISKYDGDVYVDGIVVADFDNDGKNDVAQAGFNQIIWHKNTGQGNFELGKRVTDKPLYLSQWKKMVGADLNGDGFTDLVVSLYYAAGLTYTNKLYFIISNGNGTFNEPVLIDEVLGARFTVAEMDGDGKKDIIAEKGGAVRWYKNDGAGSFTLQPGVLLPSVIIQDNIFFTDVTGDGLADMLTNDITLNQSKIHKNNGDGTFTVLQIFTVTTNEYAFGAEDIDADGDPDLIFMSGAGLKWAKNNSGVFEAQQLILTSGGFSPKPGYYTGTLITDFNADGKPDIAITAATSGKVVWYKNLGNAVFANSQNISADTGHGPGLTAGDITGDGKLELFTVHTIPGRISWYKNITTGFSAATTLGRTAYDVNCAVAGDIDGDGDTDLVASSESTGHLAWYKNGNGQGDFTIEKQFQIDFNQGGIKNLKLYDMDNDGDLDIFTEISVVPQGNTGSSACYWYKNNGLGTFTKVTVVPLSQVYEHFYLEDADADGDLDVLSYKFGSVTVRKNNGDGTFAAAQPQTPWSQEPGGDVLFADMDNDGAADLLISYYSAPSGLPQYLWYWYKNNGQGTFSNPKVIGAVGHPASYQITDFDGDGDNDIVFRYNGIRWLKNIDGQGNFSESAVMYQGSANLGIIDVADIDGDGHKDIIAGYAGNFKLAWLKNNGQQVLSAPIEINSSMGNPSWIGTADFNADGKPDIYATSKVDHSVNAFINQGMLTNTISGTVRLNSDGADCTTASPGLGPLLVSAQSGGNISSVFTNPNGNYAIFTATGTYTTTVTSPLTNFTISPASQVSTFANDSGESAAVNFCLLAVAPLTDLEVMIYPLTNVRPGFPVKYKVVVKNKGTLPVAASTMQFVWDTARLNFNASVPAQASASGNMLSFNLGTMAVLQSKEFNITFTAKTIPSIALGEQVNATANVVVNNDAAPADNLVTHTEIVVGSYDPNDIAVREGSQILLEDADEYLHYLIRFQNTGNYYAERVVVKNPLDSKLDWTTMQIESMSHTGRAEIINGAEAIFTFDAIYLPASEVNEPASHGYIAYKIKPKANVVLGDTFTEQAHIFFDFNPAIDTNVVTTTIIDNVNGLPQFTAETVSVYPVPSKAILNVKANTDIAKIELFNQAGQRVLRNTSQNSIDISALSQGIYFAKIEDVNGSAVTKKVVKN